MNKPCPMCFMELTDEELLSSICITCQGSQRTQLENSKAIRYVYWEYEDELPEDLNYDAAFGLSKVILGVRMFPYIMFNGQRYYLGDLNDNNI